MTDLLDFGWELFRVLGVHRYEYVETFSVPSEPTPFERQTCSVCGHPRVRAIGNVGKTVIALSPWEFPWGKRKCGGRTLSAKARVFQKARR